MTCPSGNTLIFYWVNQYKVHKQINYSFVCFITTSVDECLTQNYNDVRLCTCMAVPP